MYRDDQELSIDFKAVSQHALFEDDTVFLSLQNPSMEYFQGMDLALLPVVGVIQKLDPDFQEGGIEQQHIGASLKYEALLQEVAKEAGKSEEYRDWKYSKEVTKKAKVERNFGEITNMADLKARCLDYKKACGIALLPANQIVDYERENFRQHLESLDELDSSAKLSSSPVFYSWVNVTCHPEVLDFFKIDPF